MARPERSTGTAAGPNGDDIAAFLPATRALVAAAARSDDDVQDDPSLPQLRALMVLATRGAVNVTGVAVLVGVHRMMASRLVSRLADDALLRRTANDRNRREVLLQLTPAGAALVGAVRRRWEDIAGILTRMTAEHRPKAIAALAAFAEAAGEQPDESWP